MKRAELLKHAKCDLCNQPVMHTGLPLFWKVTIERFGIDVPAARRQDGLGAFMGSHQLAAVMGPDEDLAKPMMDKPAVVTVCEGCCVSRGVPVAVLASMVQVDANDPPEAAAVTYNQVPNDGC